MYSRFKTILWSSAKYAVAGAVTGSSIGPSISLIKPECFMILQKKEDDNDACLESMTSLAMLLWSVGGLLGAVVGAYYGYQEAVLIEQRDQANIRTYRP